MQQALQRVSQSSSQPLPEGKVACRAAYRLAHYADTMYCSVQKQRNSPEWATAQAVIQQKMQQVLPPRQCFQARNCHYYSTPYLPTGKVHLQTRCN